MIDQFLSLVNSLLDFSRIEAGRVTATYQPTDLSVFTAELASLFRSTIERAGMFLAIHCPPLDQPVFVDHEMWEKIVLNLISNAFKFTFHGSISVSMQSIDGVALLTVTDTGSGIPSDQIPRLFERFHRVDRAEGRSHEGTGIGLALVQELVKLHGGTVQVHSVLGRGSQFIVSVPLGHTHLPAEHVQNSSSAPSVLRAEAYVEEASRWLPSEPGESVPVSANATSARTGVVATSAKTSARILLADDNGDMRDYVRRLLADYTVEAVADGRSALASAQREKPDLILTDVMMPRLDGFGLLHELRADPALQDVPVIFLSARAGEEARIDGRQAGADDYIVKPFSARELLARVEAQLKLSHLREQAHEALRYRTAQFETLLNQAPLGVFLVNADFRVREVNPTALSAFGEVPGGIIGRDLSEFLHLLWEKNNADEIVRIFRQTLETGETHVTPQWSEFRADRQILEHYEWQVHRIVLPDGQYGVVCYFRDISKQVEADATRALLMNELNHRVKNTLSNVQAIAQQTSRHTKDPADFAARFSGRVQSLSRVNSLLTASTWQGADLRELIRDQLMRGSVDEARLTAWGPSVLLDPQSALHLAMLLHELGTNSIKYGALSAPAGSVSVSWTVQDSVLSLNWVERGGPPAAVPLKRGFGLALIEQSARSQGGSAQITASDEGLSWQIVMPLRSFDGPRVPGMKATSELIADVRTDASTAQPLAGRRFLVIEDEPMIALSIVNSLENAGAHVLSPVGNIADAVNAVRKSNFDVALLDANLHGYPVHEVAAALTRQNIQFVFISGYGEDLLPEGFRHVRFLSKPFSDHQLIEIVSKAVAKPSHTIPLRKQ